MTPDTRIRIRLTVLMCALLALASLGPAHLRTAVAARAVAATPGVDRTRGQGDETPALPAGVASDWWTAVRAQIEEDAYAVRPVTGTAAGTYEADNPAQRWRTSFTSAGLAITPAEPPARDPRDPARERLSADAGALSPDASTAQPVRSSADAESSADANVGSPAPDASTAESARLLADAKSPTAGASATETVPPAGQDWTVDLRLAAYGAGEVLTPVSAVAPQAEGARVEFRYGESQTGAPALTEWYVNQTRGIEHGFTLAEAPSGSGPVTLELAVAGGLRPVLQPDGLAVELRAADGAVRVRYADLVVTDARGRTLPSHLDVATRDSARIQLIVDSRDAIYPVTVDPMLTTPATTLTGQAADSFGYSVATAGDVNGDGYADVVVGAYRYGASTGRVYVYLGGASGLATTPATTLTGEFNSAFGVSVATAGDVNGDGYADVVVGTPGYSNNTGRAYVYLGGASGLATTAATTLTGELNSAFGVSVATAGDVNGDGYGDVVVGAYGYGSYTGRVYVYLGGPSGLPTTPATTLTGEGAGYYFGRSVATAGDVNGDGYADVVVGAYGYSTNTGRAYVYLGSASGLATTPATTLMGEAPGNYFGYSVATAGDVNGDGYGDVVVGAYGYSTNTGRAYVYLGGASGLATTPATTLMGEAPGNYFGYSVATAGDVNGDGYGDVVVGAYGYSTNTGRAYVYLGGASGLATTPATTLTGEATGNYFGTSVATAGDVNGDGYADVVVGAHGAGQAYVYLGGANGLATTPAATRTGEATSNYFGAHVATAGDVNGDGYADVVVAAPFYGSRTGRVYVYLGSPSGLGETPATILTGEAVNNNFGTSVATAGDVNGDGYADVIVGAYGYGSSTGRAYVYLGGPGGVATMPATTLTGQTAGDQFGISVATAGDVNGDGYADVVVGAPGYSNFAGRAHVYLGGASGLATTAATTLAWGVNSVFGYSVATAGDVNGDGYADVVVGAYGYTSYTGRAYVYLGGPSGLATTPATTLTGETIGDRFGSPVAAAGDVNGDGYADVVVGASGYSSYTGRAYVYLGSASGLATTAATTLTGEAANNRFGVSVATAGDVNGDGYADVVVGAYGYSSNTGRAYVYPGSASGLATTPETTLTGESADLLGYSAATAGDVNGDGYADVVVGAYGYSSYTGRVHLYAGNGGLGKSLAPRTRRADDAAPVAYGGRSELQTAFRLAAVGHTPFGRSHVKLEWEVKPLGTAFNGNWTSRSAAWQDTTTVGASLNELASGLTPSTPYHWRVRVRYHPASSPFAQYSRWITQPWAGAQETRLRTRGPNAAPTATGVSITGTLVVGQVLTGHYTYADVDGDLEAASTFRWLRGGVAIAGATALTYTTVAADVGQTLTFEVTPRAATGVVTGSPATSSVVVLNSAPTATSVNITGTLLVGQMLTGHYTYSDVDGDAEGTSTFRWLRGGVAIAGATALTYTMAIADSGQTLTFEVTPRAATGTTPGTPVASSGVVIANSAPGATALSITGTLTVGQVLTGHYTYADVDGDAEGTSTFRWLRGGVAIAGATAPTHTTVAADSGQTLTFEVTPRAATGTTPGTPVASSGVVIANSAPAATALSITGTLTVGQVLTGHYTYADVDGDAEGTSTFRWLRGGVAIDGATALTYTTVTADIGQTLSLEVTPRAATGTTPGTPATTTGVVITKATPIITWANPASIAAFTALGSAQLNATSTVAGYFVYTPPPGAVLTAGAGQTLSVTFTPTDTANYTAATKTVTIDVAKATPVITWANPASITSGTALGATQLNATASFGGASVLGTFAYTPAAGTVLAAGTHTLSVTFTPTDATNYAPVTTTATIVVLGTQPAMTVSPATLRFAGTNMGGTLGPITPAQTVTVSFSSATATAWSVAADQPWVQITGGSGIGSGTFRVSIINPGSVLDGVTSASATLTVTAVGASNSPRTVAVTLTLNPEVLHQPAIGIVEAPAQGATGRVGAIGVTGWVVDDVGIKSVKIYRNCLAFEPAVNCAVVNGVNLVYIGDATIVTGARPDIEAAYATYPMNNRAGWGYLLLTSMLPHIPNQQMYGGQGTLTLYVLAEDIEGHQRWLGRDFVTFPAETNQVPTTFTMANDTIAKPFGAIDTPTQGQTVGGSFWNFGWTLTPDSNTTAEAGDIVMPLTGSTQWVYVDGAAVAPIGAYNLCRGTVGSPPTAGVYCNDDVSNIFGNPTPQPTFAARSSNPTRHRNLDAGRGPIAAYYLDTTTLANGVHTIVWGVTDSAGRGEGIGSRYFTVLNGAGDAAGRDHLRQGYGGPPELDAKADESSPYACTSAGDAVPAGSARASRSGATAFVQDGADSGIRRGGPPCPPDSRGATTEGCPDTLTRQAAEAALREAPAVARGEASALDTLTPATGHVWGRTGFDLNSPYAELTADEAGVRRVQIPDLGRLELWLGAVEHGYLVANGTLRDLPPGSSLTIDTGVFTWSPGLGYLGTYRLVFVTGSERTVVEVTIGR